MPSPVELVIDNRVRIRGELSSEVRRELKSEFDYSNPTYFRMRGIGKAVWNIPRRVQTWTEERGELSFPRGGSKRVRDLLRAGGVPYSIRDERVEGQSEPRVKYRSPGGPPAQHQLEAVAALIAKQNALLRIPTGGRKTSIGMMLAAEVDVATLYLVDTTQLFGQWRERVVSELGVGLGDMGLIGDGEMRLRPITVGMIPTLASKFKRSDAERIRIAAYFGCVVVDEVQGAAADRTAFVVDAMPAKYRFGLSDDERRSDGKEFLTYDLFGQVAYSADRERLVRDGVIVDVEIRVVPTAFEAPWYGMPDDLVDDGEEGGKEIDFDRLLKQMAPDEARNLLGVEQVLAEVRAGEQVLVMTARREHCQILSAMLAARGCPSGNLIGGEDMRAEFNRSIARIRSGECRVGVGTIQAIGKALDLPKVGVGLLASPLAGNPYKFRQARGRFCRASAGKTCGRLIVLWDKHVYPKHLRNMVSWNPTVSVLRDGSWVSAATYQNDAGLSAQLDLV